MTRSPFQRSAEPGIRAIRHNLRPFLLIQACSFGVVGLYYGVPAFQELTSGLAEFKARSGIPFVAASTAFAGFVFPQVAKRLTLRDLPPLTWQDILFQVGFFALIGTLVDTLYRSLGALFGGEVTVGLVAKKVLFDQFLFSPLVSITLSTSLFIWYENGFSVRRAVQVSRRGAWIRRYVPLLLMCWAFWIPTLCASYALPLNLQFWLFLFAQGAWSLLLLHASSDFASQESAGSG